jgi:hypothetical protein
MITPKILTVARIVINQLLLVKLTERRRESRARCRKQGSNKECDSGDHGRRIHVAIGRAMINVTVTVLEADRGAPSIARSSSSAIYIEKMMSKDRPDPISTNENTYVPLVYVELLKTVITEISRHKQGDTILKNKNIPCHLCYFYKGFCAP